MRPIDGDEAIRAIPKWKRYGVDEEGKLSEWKTGSPAYVNLEDVLDTIARMPTIDISTGWIPVTDRLPEERGDYIVSSGSEVYISLYLPYGFSSVVNGGLRPALGPAFVDMVKDTDTTSGWVYFDEWEHVWMDETRCILAWMPLPEPYRKD